MKQSYICPHCNKRMYICELCNKPTIIKLKPITVYPIGEIGICKECQDIQKREEQKTRKDFKRMRERFLKRDRELFKIISLAPKVKSKGEK